MNLYEELSWRGLVYHATDGVTDAFAKERVTAYIGFDPTASSLHVGSLLTVMGLARLQRFGHSPIAIVGGGTGMIGDPSGKTVERQLLTRDQIEEALELRPNAHDVPIDLIGREEDAFLRFAARVPDHPRAAADNRNRSMAESLKARQSHHGQQ